MSNKMMRDAQHLVNESPMFYFDLEDIFGELGSAHTGGPGAAASTGRDVRSGM
ncbi:hypothetical protein G3I24_47375 [Micromonospora aurantiaca]|nr:hypothetical protein [Micromonospora aurantiaca]